MVIIYEYWSTNIISVDIHKYLESLQSLKV